VSRVDGQRWEAGQGVQAGSAGVSESLPDFFRLMRACIDRKNE